MINSLSIIVFYFIFYKLCILSYSSEVSKTNLFKSSKAIRLGITISPLNKSASSQTKSTFWVDPMKIDIITKTL